MQLSSETKFYDTLWRTGDILPFLSPWLLGAVSLAPSSDHLPHE